MAATKVVLELGCNHQGDVSLAHRMIEDAAKLGVYGVKIQMRDVEEIPEETRQKRRDPATSFGDTYYAHRKALELSDQEIVCLKSHAETAGLSFMVSVFDMPSAKRAVEGLGIRFVKLPSQLLGEPRLNHYLAEQRMVGNLFTIRSTGMHTVQEAFACLARYTFNLTMYCRSAYPVELPDVDLGAARAIFAHLSAWERGYSSHDRDGAAIPWLVLLGASWVERHYTLDKSMKGSDHHTVSSDFEDMKRILGEIEEVDSMLSPKNSSTLAIAEERANRDFYMPRKAAT